MGMSYEEFKAQVVDMIRKAEGQGTEVNIVSVTKNNGLVLDALTILRAGKNISPTIYLEKYYRFFCMKNVSLEEVVGDILREHAAHDVAVPVNAEQLLDFANVKNRIYPRLVNYARNRSLLDDIPHRRFLDLAVIYYFEVSEEPIGNATMILRNRSLECWKVSEEELYNLAMENVRRDKPTEIIPMGNIMEEIGGQPLPEEQETALSNWQMNIATNKERVFGSVCLLEPEVFQTIAERTGANLFILPSSIHEVIVVANNGSCSKTDLERMVIDVNETQVLEQEVLSDHVYLYDKERKEVML